MMLSDVCLSDVWRRLSRTSRPAGGMCGRPTGRLGWRVLAYRARLSRPNSRLPLRASVAGGGGILWRPPAQLVHLCANSSLWRSTSAVVAHLPTVRAQTSCIEGWNLQFSALSQEN